MNFENLQMNNNGPPPTNGPRNESIENRGNTNGAITTEGAIAALEQHDQLFQVILLAGVPAVAVVTVCPLYLTLLQM